MADEVSLKMMIMEMVEDNDVGNEGINENTNDFSPSSLGSSTNP